MCYVCDTITFSSISRLSAYRSKMLKVWEMLTWWFASRWLETHSLEFKFKISGRSRVGYHSLCCFVVNLWTGFVVLYLTDSLSFRLLVACLYWAVSFFRCTWWVEFVGVEAACLSFHIEFCHLLRTASCTYQYCFNSFACNCDFWWIILVKGKIFFL